MNEHDDRRHTVEEATQHRDDARVVAQRAPSREAVMALGYAGLALNAAERQASASADDPDEIRPP